MDGHDWKVFYALRKAQDLLETCPWLSISACSSCLRTHWRIHSSKSSLMKALIRTSHSEQLNEFDAYIVDAFFSYTSILQDYRLFIWKCSPVHFFEVGQYECKRDSWCQIQEMWGFTTSRHHQLKILSVSDVKNIRKTHQLFQPVIEAKATDKLSPSIETWQLQSSIREASFKWIQ